jgi:hypothetical protein
MFVINFVAWRWYLVYLRNMWGLGDGIFTVVLLQKILLDFLVCPLDDEIKNPILRSFTQKCS